MTKETMQAMVNACVNAETTRQDASERDRAKEGMA